MLKSAMKDSFWIHGWVSQFQKIWGEYSKHRVRTRNLSFRPRFPANPCKY